MSRGWSPSLTGKLAQLPADACRFPSASTSRCAVSASAVAGGPTMATRKPNDDRTHRNQATASVDGSRNGDAGAPGKLPDLASLKT